MATDLVHSGHPSPGRLVAAAFFVVFILVQVAVPVTMLLGPRPAPFSWQMPPGVPRTTSYGVQTAEGLTTFDVREYLVLPGADLDRPSPMPSRLCADVEGALSVQLEGRDGSMTVPCG